MAKDFNTIDDFDVENKESTYFTLKFNKSDNASACWDNVVKSFLPGRLW